MTCVKPIAIAVLSLLFLPDAATAEPGNATRGQRVFGACLACHSLEPNRNMTGPSLAGVWNRKAGTLGSFPRYSPALKSSGLVWDDKSLDEYLTDPQHFIPGNTMTFPGIKDAQQRADLLAFLEEATQPGRAPSSQSAQQDAPMGGMMGSRAAPNLKKLDPAQRVRSIRICRETYHVTTVNGMTRDFWERNLRFKTDSSDEGPEKGAPAILRAGMLGDRASVIFASSDEISEFISPGC
jgi:cytochrome c